MGTVTKISAEMRHYHKRKAEGICVNCNKPAVNQTVVCAEHMERRKAYGKWYKKVIREKVLEHYGKKCACCGETEEQFLTIDHINNDGAQQRRTFHRDTYLWAVKQGFPKDLQILCYNCNCAKGAYGVCPHTPPTRF